MAHDVGQQHPLSVYFWVWGLLFVLSSFSYMVDFYQVTGRAQMDADYHLYAA